MRAPPESLRPTTGAPTFIAWSITLQIFRAWAAEREPPKTVKSWLNANTRRPFTRPWPITTPSPGTRWRAIPKSWESCSTNMSHSSKDPSSKSSSRRSRAVSLPLACWAAIRFSPPPRRAASRRRSSSRRMSCTVLRGPEGTKAGAGTGAGTRAEAGAEAESRPQGQAARRRLRTSPRTSRAAAGMEVPGP